ncbi:MAG: tyrosine-protein phosphatase, partial [Clostridia bacterium]|nr:tyrosine-protein phosphatase [Clostridia bacterium]
DLATLPGPAWETIYTDVPVIVNDNTELTMVLKNGGGNNLFLGDLKFTMVASETTYAKITVKAGEYYEQNGNGGLIVANDYTFYIYNDDLWRDPPPADFVVDITFEKMSDVSKINGANWNMYVAPYGAVSVIGKSWTTKWADLVYEVDGVAYTAEMQRAEPKNGMFFQIPGTNLSPATESATVVIKAGTYACTTGDAPSVRVTEDYTFYVVNGAVYSEFDFDNPKFTETVIVDADGGSYTITDAETVTIDGVTYNQGDVYTTIGTHTLVYSKYNREYTRKVIIYRVGEVGDTAEIDVCDVVMLQRYLSHQTALSESAMLGADLNNDGEVNAGDMLLLRHKLLLIEGLMVLAPADGVTAMGPSEQVEALVIDYDPYALKGDELQNGTEQFHRDPLLLRWTATEDFASYQVHVATKADFSDEMVHTTTSTEYVLVNLLPATTYYWKVTAGGFATETRSFVTEDTIRTLTIGGVDNARDIGGYATGENTRLKYGMVYRTATLDTITEDGLYQMLTVLGIKTELDVRTPGEGTAGASVLGNTINYINYSGPYYYNTTSGILAAAYQDALRAEIRAFADEDNYPIVVHCSVGRDRTGTILFLIEGLCGVSKTDLYMEYELSFLGRIGGNGANVTHLMNEVDKMYNGIQTYAPDGTFAEACEAFMLSVGITQAEIDTIRELMTEVIGEEEPTDPEQPDPNDPNTDFDPDEDETEIF